MGLNPDMTVRIGPAVFPNPVGVASGTFGYGNEYDQLMDLKRLGAIYTKAVTMERRPGNAPPRIVETPSGMLNTIGLANPGIDAFIRDKLPELKELPCAIVVNVAGAGEDDYLKVVERLEESSGIAGYEINLSCPNVKHGGLSFGTDPAQVRRITERLRPVTKKAVIVKLTPNVTDVVAVARAAAGAGADALSLVNTVRALVLDPQTLTPFLGNRTGGLSGPAIKPVALRMVWQLAGALDTPIIGMGGIACGRDVLEFVACGATAVAVGAANFGGPDVPGRIVAELRAELVGRGLPDLAAVRGRALA